MQKPVIPGFLGPAELAGPDQPSWFGLIDRADARFLAPRKVPTKANKPRAKHTPGCPWASFLGARKLKIQVAKPLF
jgi:hypothetical protein